MNASGGFRERRYTAQDGLSLCFRDYGDATTDELPLLCLAGLTRNSKDFDAFARRLAPRRVLCPDYRGRGRSDRDPDARRYEPWTYVSDILHLLALANIHRLVVVGTSLGGILAMILGAARPSSLAGVVLNDIGPDIPTDGRERIARHAEEAGPYPSLDAAAQALRANYGSAYPDLDDAGWRAMAETSFVRDADDRYRFDYDPRIARTVRGAPGDDPRRLWDLFGTLARIPTLCVRGALSDVLRTETVAAMTSAKPDLQSVEVPNRGHTPELNEPTCVEAIDRFLGGLEA